MAIKKSVSRYWKEKIIIDATNMSSLEFLGVRSGWKLATHQIWPWTGTYPNSKDAKRTAVKAKLATGTYPLFGNKIHQKSRQSTLCPLCERCDEDLKHFLLDCPELQKTRQCEVEEVMRLVDANENRISDRDLIQIIVDCSNSPYLLEVPDPTLLVQIEWVSRRLVFNLYCRRCYIIRDRGLDSSVKKVSTHCQKRAVARKPTS